MHNDGVVLMESDQLEQMIDDALGLLFCRLHTLDGCHLFKHLGKPAPIFSRLNDYAIFLKSTVENGRRSQVDLRDTAMCHGHGSLSDLFEWWPRTCDFNRLDGIGGYGNALCERRHRTFALGSYPRATPRLLGGENKHWGAMPTLRREN